MAMRFAPAILSFLVYLSPRGFDPLTYAAVIAILFAALIAALVPALRAMRVDPIVALRYE